MMDSRAAHLIDTLGLSPHPEGGYYRQLYRSQSFVRPDDERPARPALTTIYFLLPAGECSRWHVVASDEAWHFYEGAPLDLFVGDPDLARVTHETLGNTDGVGGPVHVVRAHYWQAARTTGAYTLVGCTVAPGFEFSDFSLLRDRPADADRLRSLHPTLAKLI
jgi:predicted cupin superfamily sugar epimerase